MPAKDDKTAPTVEDLTRQIEALRADVAALAETLKALGQSRTRAAADEMRERAGAARAAGEERLEDLFAEADRMTRDRPATAMGLAAGLGFVIGLLLGRR